MNLFISGIGGAGLGPLAELALDAGYQVFGSDLNHSLQTAELETRGVQISYAQSREDLAKVHQQNPIDWLIHSSAIPETSPELRFAKASQIRVSKRDEFLASFIREKKLKLIAVAGTHGKTTTTAMLVWTFKTLNLPISYSVGATLPFANSGHYDKNSRFFLYEADEYDRNFLKFSPEISLIPSIDYDHADTYPTREDYQNAFREFISQSQKTILWHNDFVKLKISPDIQALKNSRQNRSMKSYTNQNLAKNLDKFLILNRESPLAKINLPGAKNRENAELVLALFRELWPEIARENLQIIDGFNAPKIANILSQFPGTSRRMEKLRENLYTDYAHHPTEIAATLEKAREILNLQNSREASTKNSPKIANHLIGQNAQKLIREFAKNSGETSRNPHQDSSENHEKSSPKKLVAIYQPHQNLRQLEILRDGGYGMSFDEADEIFWLPTYLVRGDLSNENRQDLPEKSGENTRKKSENNLAKSKPKNHTPQILSPADLIKTLSKKSRKIAKSADLNDELFAEISQHLREGNLVVAMGAGTIDSWLREKLAR